MNFEFHLKLFDLVWFSCALYSNNESELPILPSIEWLNRGIVGESEIVVFYNST